MNDHTCQTSDVPVDTLRIDPPLSLRLQDIRTVIWDAQYQHDRVNAVLLNLRDLLMLTATHEDDASQLDPTNLSHGISDALGHLKALSNLIDHIFVIADPSDDSPSDTTKDRRTRYQFWSRWSG